MSYSCASFSLKADTSGRSASDPTLILRYDYNALYQPEERDIFGRRIRRFFSGRNGGLCVCRGSVRVVNISSLLDVRCFRVVKFSNVFRASVADFSIINIAWYALCLIK